MPGTRQLGMKRTYTAARMSAVPAVSGSGMVLDENSLISMGIPAMRTMQGGSQNRLSTFVYAFEFYQKILFRYQIDEPCLYELFRTVRVIAGA